HGLEIEQHLAVEDQGVAVRQITRDGRAGDGDAGQIAVSAGRTGEDRIGGRLRRVDRGDAADRRNVDLDGDVAAVPEIAGQRVHVDAEPFGRPRGVDVAI